MGLNLECPDDSCSLLHEVDDQIRAQHASVQGDR